MNGRVKNMRNMRIRKAIAGAFAALAFASVASAAGLENEYVTLTFGAKGEIVSLKDRTNGRELVKKPMPFAEVRFKDGRKIHPVRFAQRGDRLGWTFEDGGGFLLKVEPFEGGWTFTSEKFTVEDAEELEYFRITPACNTYKGGYANMFSDDEDAVCIRAYDLKLEMPSPGGNMWATYFPVQANRADGFTGLRCGLAAGPKDRIQKMLQAMTLVANVPWSKCGGAWCLGAPENRSSYIFSYYEGTNFDEWLNVLKLTGIGTIHFHLWYSSSGNYTNINRKKFPKGLESLKEAADAVHDAGYRVSLHTLSALIAGPNPWTAPVASEGLQSVFQYTTLNDLVDGVTELRVKERPDDDMDTVQTYGSLGNFLRIGGEIVQYTGIRREPPYAFTGITRGSQGTKVYDHKAGETAHYLRARYYGIYPDAESTVMDEIADKFATVYNTIGADRVFFDGAEGIGPRYGRRGNYQIGLMLNKLYSKLGDGKKPVQMEMSCWNKHTWWIRANAGVIDGGKYALKVFDRNHLKRASENVKANLLEPQLGWWKPGDWTDETDYYGAHAAGIDGAISLYGPIRDVNNGPLGMHWQTQITLLGWYEHFRMAMAYTDEALAKFRDFESECRLRQDAAGEWRVEDVECLTHRVTGAATKKWTVERPASCAIEPVIHILGGTESYADPAAIPVANGSVAGEMKIATSDKKLVTAKVEKLADPRRGDCFRFTAVNATSVRSNAWAQAKLDWGKDLTKLRDFSPSDGIGFWVKGDGSGALLDVRLHQSATFGNAPSDHLVRLDFTGWKYFEFLYAERDAYEYVKHVWPNKPDWGIFSSVFNPTKIAEVELVLAELPVKKAKEVFLDMNADAAMAKSDGTDIVVSEIRAVTKKMLELSDAALTVNGRKYMLPFESLATGDRIALEDGTWVLRDGKGELKRKVKTGDRLSLRAGENTLAFTAESLSGDPRADVKFIVPGKSVQALKPSSEWPGEWKWHGMFEAMAPVEYAPKKGATELPNLKMRPGERAQLEVQVVGDVKDPVLEYSTADGWQKVRIPSVSGGRRVKVPTDHLLAGVRELRFSCANPDEAVCRVEIIKHYTDKPATDKTPPPPVVKEPTKWELLAERMAADMKANGFSDAEIEKTKALIIRQ